MLPWAKTSHPLYYASQAMYNMKHNNMDVISEDRYGSLKTIQLLHNITHNA
jgi:hypothetical protein